MNPAAANPLDQLRGYHMPQAVSWWPPAPGWWLLAGLVIVAIAGLTWWALRRYRRRASWRQAQNELKLLRAARNDDAEFVRNVSKLLRRYALKIFPAQDVAALTGDAWLAFLDRNGGNGRFRDGPGRQLMEAPYRPDAKIDRAGLIGVAEEWIRRNRSMTS